MYRRRLSGTVAALMILTGATLDPVTHSVASAQGGGANCRSLPTAAELRALLVEAAKVANGGIVGGLFLMAPV